MSTFTIRLPDTLRKELKQLSKEEKIPAGQIIRQSIDWYLSVTRFRKLRNRVLPFSEAQGLLTDEDIFKALRR